MIANAQIVASLIQSNGAMCLESLNWNLSLLGYRALTISDIRKLGLRIDPINKEVRGDFCIDLTTRLERGVKLNDLSASFPKPCQAWKATRRTLLKGWVAQDIKSS